MSPANIFIVIPAFNEETRLGRVLSEIEGDYPNIVVIDDGSSDGTLGVAREHRCVILRHVVNRGQGAALQTGITYSLRAGASLIVTFDADGQHQAADIPAMLAPLKRGEAQVTLGSRFLEKDSNVPPSRRLMLRAARAFTRLTAGLDLTDCHNGFRAFTRQAAQCIDLRQDRMAHASELYDQIRSAGLEYREVAVSVKYSAETLAKGQGVLDSVKILVDYLFGKVPK